jgi:hypothetical protein
MCAQNNRNQQIEPMKITTLVKNPQIIARASSCFGPATILFSLVLLPSAQEAPAQNIYTMDVPITVPWTDTGINIAAGSRLEITASGIVAFGGSPGQTTDANGGDVITGQQFFQDCVLPNTVCHSFIGKIGGTTDIGTGTPVSEVTPGDGPGFVGISYSEVTSTGGELFLGFNDEIGGFGDNSGSFSVTVDVVPVPEPSTVALVGFGVLVLLVRFNKQQGGLPGRMQTRPKSS